MKRSIRRRQQRVAAVRRVRILLAHRTWHPVRSGREKPWKRLSTFLMNEPGWWVHERIVVPARTATRRLEHAVIRGLDPDGVVWPDCKKPHDYYW